MSSKPNTTVLTHHKLTEKEKKLKDIIYKMENKRKEKELKEVLSKIEHVQAKVVKKLNKIQS